MIEEEVPETVQGDPEISLEDRGGMIEDDDPETVQDDENGSLEDREVPVVSTILLRPTGFAGQARALHIRSRMPFEARRAK
jgi:hypothetical protein